VLLLAILYKSLRKTAAERLTFVRKAAVSKNGAGKVFIITPFCAEQIVAKRKYLELF